MAAKKKPKSDKRLNKSEWIRKQPGTVSAKDIVAKAKQEGFKLSLAQVYTARSAAKKKVDRRRPKGSGTEANGLDDLHDSFMKLAIRIGTDEAKRLLERIIDVPAVTVH